MATQAETHSSLRTIPNVFALKIGKNARFDVGLGVEVVINRHGAGCLQQGLRFLDHLQQEEKKTLMLSMLRKGLKPYKQIMPVPTPLDGKLPQGSPPRTSFHSHHHYCFFGWYYIIIFKKARDLRQKGELEAVREEGIFSTPFNSGSLYNRSFKFQQFVLLFFWIVYARQLRRE